MNVRDKKIVIYVGMSLIIFSLFVLHFSITHKAVLYKNLSEKLKKDLKVVSALAEEAQKYSIEAVKERLLPPNFSLFSYVESKAREAGLTVRSINPSSGKSKGSVKEVSVVLTSKETPFISVVRFLHSIENDSEYYLKIEKCTIKRSFKNPDLLDVKMEMTAFQREK